MALPDRVLLDTNCFVYLLEDPTSPRGRLLLDDVFAPAVAGRRQIFAATLTVTELLAQPYAAGQGRRAAGLLAALEALPGLTLVPLSTGVAVNAARIRGQSGLLVPDAIVLATAQQADATLLTNDRRLASHADPVLLLDDLVAAG